MHDKFVSEAFTLIVDKFIVDKFHAVRRGGNKVSHERKVAQHDVIWVLKESYYRVLALHGGRVLGRLPLISCVRNFTTYKIPYHSNL